jgi:eukaryotic-like serine/threonine-protein kinase
VPPAIPGLELLRLLGRGDSNAVWLARDADGVEVAVKLIPVGSPSAAHAASLHHEQRVLARIDHPQVVRLHGCGEDAAGKPYLALEHIDGPDLRTWLATRRPLAQRLALLAQIARALDHVHGQQIVHRDLTSANVVVDQQGNARLIDFDKARVLSAPGTAADFAGDMHALGRIMTALLGDGAGRELAAIAARASAGRPQDRYATMAELLADLDALAARRPVRAYASTRRYALRKWLSRHRLWLGIALLLALLLTAAITAMMVSPTGLEPVTR